ncbi:aminotransferase class i and ii [Moniliophthora roreri]|nr:aminotransferase class i and ii [Moniliophthora roreri]KAI3621104.1 aminotransferase class i and ii [Moniliophthora roreri]
MSSTLNFRLSRAVLSTISPPIPQAYKWGALYPPKPERPLLDMSQGVPGSPPPEKLRNALQTASALPNSFGYCPAQGEITLRTEFASEMKEAYGKDADLTHEDLALTVGCNMAFVASIMSLADAGDEVILPVPWYFNHQMTLTLLGITPVPLETISDNGFLPSTGAIYPPSLLASFLSLAREHNIALIIDETYRDFLVDANTGNPKTPHALFSKTNAIPWRSSLVHLYSFSKSYRIPGHRLGCIVASPALIQEIIKVLDTLQICPPRIPQLALGQPGLLADLRGGIRDTSVQVAKRHELFKEYLPDKWKIASQGGYYAFVRHPFAGIGSVEVCKRLAIEMGVVVLPGAFFREESKGKKNPDDVDDRWIRFSVANVNNEKVKWVCERLKESEGTFGWEIDVSC